MDLIISVFISLKGANNAIYCLFVKELDPNIMIGHKKFFAEAFFGHEPMTSPAMKKLAPVIVVIWGGVGGVD